MQLQMALYEELSGLSGSTIKSLSGALPEALALEAHFLSFFPTIC